MVNQIVIRALFLGAFGAAFVIGAFQHTVGSLSHAGPGLFPTIVGSLLILIAGLMLIQSRTLPAIPMQFNLRNITIIIAALLSFVVVSHLGSTALAIVSLTFIGSMAGSSFSWKRSLKVSIALILIAIAFQKFLGLNLQVI